MLALIKPFLHLEFFVAPVATRLVLYLHGRLLY